MYSEELGRSLDALAVNGAECLTVASAARVVAEGAHRDWRAQHVSVVRGANDARTVETLASVGSPVGAHASALVRRVRMGLVRNVRCDLVLAVPDAATLGGAHREHDLCLYARQAGWFLVSVDRLENLHHAMITRATIAQAQGLLMARYDIDAAQALLVMRRRSQETHVRLARVAEDVVAARTAELDGAP